MDGPAFETWQLALIAELRVGRLATVGSGGAPHLVPVCYAFEGGAFWIAIDEKPKTSLRLARLANIQRDPRVALLFDRYEEDWTRLAWVRVDGLATVLQRGATEAVALAALRRRYAQYLAMDLETRPLVRIEPVRVSGWRSDDRWLESTGGERTGR